MRLSRYVTPAVLFLAWVLAWSACTGSQPLGSNEPGHPDTAVAVERWVDGDTVVVTGYGAKRETVRLIGVDTPETVHPRKPVECYGRQASAFVKALLPVGSAATLTFDKGTTELRDRTPSRRLLAYLWKSDDTMVNLELVRQGYAKAVHYPPQDDYRDTFKQAEAKAKAATKGRWKACQS
jgi:micrococcal nuclease